MVQPVAKAEPLRYVSPHKVALDGAPRPPSDVGSMPVPNPGIEHDHRSGFPKGKNLARVLGPSVGDRIAWDTGPVMRSRNEARSPILSPEAIDHKNEPQHWS